MACTWLTQQPLRLLRICDGANSSNLPLMHLSTHGSPNSRKQAASDARALMILLGRAAACASVILAVIVSGMRHGKSRQNTFQVRGFFFLSQRRGDRRQLPRHPTTISQLDPGSDTPLVLWCCSSIFGRMARSLTLLLSVALLAGAVWAADEDPTQVFLADMVGWHR